MNRTRTSKNAKRLLVWLLLLTMVFGLLPMAAFADETVVEPVVSEEPVQEPEPSSEPTEAPSEPTQKPETISELEQPGNADVTIESDEEQPEDEDMLETASLTATDYVAPPAYTIDPSNPIRVYHIDCGRKYFSATQINAIIDKLAEYGYTHIELAFGNEGLRFLLDNMSVNANDTTYDGGAIKSAIQSFNASFDNSSENLSETDMNSIFSHAAEKGIEIIPLLNSPGHMDAILSAMEAVGMKDVKYKNSARTVDITNVKAVNFTMALVEKYVEYFAGKGCQFFNIGTDEYANDVTSGFADLITARKYGDFVTYVNNLDNIVKSHGMLTIAFNDGIYYNDTTNYGTFYSDIIISYWTSGWTGYSPASPDFLINRGHKILNTNDAWYYVLGRRSGNYPLSNAQNGVNKKAYNVLTNGSTINENSLVGCMMCLWCDDPKASYNDSELSTISDLLSTFAQKNSTVFKTTTPGGGESGGGSTGGNGDVKEIRVSVGETKTEVVSETKDVRGSFKDDKLDKSTAEVSPDYINTPGGTTRKLGSVVAVANSSSSTGLISDGTNYMVIDSDGNISSTTDINDATEFTVTRSWNYSSYVYTIQGNGNYLTYSSYSGLSTSTSSYDSFSFSYNSTGFCYSSGYGYYRTTYYLTYSASGWKMDESLTTYGKLYSFTTENKDDVSKTVLTIKGVAVGTTYCEINGKTYKIIVEDKAPTGAMTSNSLTLEYWITNYEVYDGQSTSTNHTQTITTSTAGATSDEGIEIATIAPSPAYSFFDGTKTVYYWQAMRLDADNKQTNASSVDRTGVGTTLTHVRYYGGAWQYKTVDGVWHYFLNTDQLVAYYLQKTEVTKEIDSYVKDWGRDPNDWGKSGVKADEDKGSVALTVAVVYPDGTVSPAESDMYANSTTIFNFWANRDIGIVAPKNNSDYNISKITVTEGKRERTTSDLTNDQWYGTQDGNTDKINWNKVTRADGSEWYDETVAWDKVTNAGTTPMVNGALGDKITWPAKNYAKLVLIYLEPVEKKTNLNVVWYDDNANAEIGRMQIAMTYTGNEEPKYDTALMDGSGNCIGDKKLWSSNDRNSEDYLPDDAYVTNSSNVKQPISKSLSGIQNVSGIYTSGLYQYISADISDDGKTLTLHYNLKADSGKVYVVDFGLPVVIPVSAFDVEDFETVNTISFSGTDTKKVERDGSYGHGSINTTTGDVTYTLQKPLDTKIPIPVYFTFAGNAQVVVRNVYVMPASNVYYEDSFVTFNPGSYGDNNTLINWTTVYETGRETDKEATQQLSELSSGDIYGFDEAYKDSTEFSMGSAHKVTVTSSMRDGWSQELSAWPTAKFSFKGTGFDVISLTNNTSGAILVDVYDSNGNKVKGYFVDNYFGYGKNDAGEWVEMPNGGDNILYQIPVIKVSGLTYGNYNVTITVFYNDAFEHNEDNSYDFWLDAIRVYEPLGSSGNDSYTVDGEGYPQYIRLHDEIVKEGSSVGTSALFIEGEKEADVAGYTNLGPNNEVYLANGQAISFKLSTNDKIDKVQIGAKAPTGTTGMTVNKDTASKVEITSATEMYYDITTVAKGGQVTITNNTGNILSLTNIKVTFSAENEVTLVALDDAAKENAVEIVRTLFAAPVVEQEKTFEPSHFKATWSKNVRAGERAVLTVKTSEDVESITVNGVPVTTYKTRTERTGWGRNAQRVTYREFTYMISAAQNADYTVIAVNAEGTSSAPQIASLNVIPARPTRPGWGWLEDLFGRWF